jgi:hypothetical protein
MNPSWWHCAPVARAPLAANGGIGRYPFRWPSREGRTCPVRTRRSNVLAVTLLGISIAGRELLIIGAVIVIMVMIGIVLMQRRPPK